MVQLLWLDGSAIMVENAKTVEYLFPSHYGEIGGTKVLAIEIITI